MNSAVSRIVIVGGGTAGWLSACLIAARAARGGENALQVTLIESPDIPTIGVGEGTWPTMRGTLESIGLRESEFLEACDASFKQGSRFDGWRSGADGDSYYHPFAPPPGDPGTLASSWLAHGGGSPFADFVSPQPAICALDLAPRQRSMLDYAGALNYAYHFDAGKFAGLLKRHATAKLGTRHLSDNVTGVEMAANGDIAAVRTRENGNVPGDLFIDCTGHSALLIGGQYQVPFIDRGRELFNDRALAIQVPISPQSAIASQTISTAHKAGWIWDIGLSSRRGVGCVYSSSHMDDAEAEGTLRVYLARTADQRQSEELAFRRLTFRSGHRQRFWERNCLAVGLSAGFLEPLEASAIVLIELSLEALLDNFPRSRDSMDLHARRFNALFAYRWDRIVDFLKLHYVLSERQESYWQDNRAAASVSPELTDLLRLWKDQPPSSYDLPSASEVFPAASYQYVLYGMGFPAPQAGLIAERGEQAVVAALAQVKDRARALASALPTNRAYLDGLRSSCEAAQSNIQELY